MDRNAYKILVFAIEKSSTLTCSSLGFRLAKERVNRAGWPSVLRTCSSSRGLILDTKSIILRGLPRLLSTVDDGRKKISEVRSTELCCCICCCCLEMEMLLSDLVMRGGGGWVFRMSKLPVPRNDGCNTLF